MCLCACVYFPKKRVYSFHQIFKRGQYPKGPKDHWPGEFSEIQYFLEYCIFKLLDCRDVLVFTWSLTSSLKWNQTKGTIAISIFTSRGSKTRKNLPQQAAYPSMASCLTLLFTVRLHVSLHMGFSRKRFFLFLSSSKLKYATRFYLLMS